MYVRRASALLAGIIGVSVFLYGALLLGAVAHTAGRTSAEGQVKKLSSAVSVLENTFFTETKALTPERAAALGFVSPQTVFSVYAGTGSLTLR